MGIVLTQFYRASLAISDVVRSGQGIRRLVTLCGNIQQLVKESDRRLAGGACSDDEDSDNENPTVSQPPQNLEEISQQ